MELTLARGMIDYNPTTSLRNGLKETWNWFVNNQEEFLLKKNYFKEEA
jgi:GDP-L-fucose synthase